VEGKTKHSKPRSRLVRTHLRFGYLRIMLQADHVDLLRRSYGTWEVSSGMHWVLPLRRGDLGGGGSLKVERVGMA